MADQHLMTDREWDELTRFWPRLPPPPRIGYPATRGAWALTDVHPPNAVDYDSYAATYTVRNDRAVHNAPQSPGHRVLLNDWRDRVFDMPAGQARLDAMRRHPLPVREYVVSHESVWGSPAGAFTAPPPAPPRPRVPAVVSFTGRRPIAVGDDEEV